MRSQGGNVYRPVTGGDLGDIAEVAGDEGRRSGHGLGASRNFRTKPTVLNVLGIPVNWSILLVHTKTTKLKLE